MKLSDIDYSTKNSKEFELLHPVTKLPFNPPVKISLYHHESKVGQISLTETHREILKLMQDKENLNELGNLKDDLLEVCNITHISRLVSGWNGIDDENNKPLEFTPENALKVLQNEMVYNFVVNKVRSLENFFRV